MHMLNIPYTRLLIVALILFVVMGTSCSSTQKVTYFNNIQDTTVKALNINLDPVIQKNDLLSITVSSVNPDAAQLFNAPNIPAAGGATLSGPLGQATGYLVNQEGFIRFPFLGDIKAEGLTKEALEGKLKDSLLARKLLVDPIVNIRYLNYRVTVLGEVTKPTVVTVPSEKITILEALGMAGDMTIYAKRDNVLLIREENGQKMIRRINLNSGSIFSSPYFYLQSNDVVYVEPNKAKVGSTSQLRQWLPSVLSGLSFIAILMDRIFK